MGLFGNPSRRSLQSGARGSEEPFGQWCGNRLAFFFNIIFYVAVKAYLCIK